MNVIWSVSLPPLSAPTKGRADLRGIIAMFYLKDTSPDVHSRGIVQVQNLFVPLGTNVWENMTNKIGRAGDIGDCILQLNGDGSAVAILHKYWDDAMVDAFRNLVKAVAPVHHWIINASYE